MTLSTKWTAFSFLALTVAAAGTFAFAGCTVTSGSVNDNEGGIGNPAVDSGKSDGGADADAAAATCEGNTQDPAKPLVNAACQDALNAACCTELKTCFAITIDADAGAGDAGVTKPLDCAKYATCIQQADLLPTPAEQEAAADDCIQTAPDDVVNAYNAIITCAEKDPKATQDCN